MKLLDMILFAADTNNVGQYQGGQHWAYYLMGGIFLILAIICIYFSYRWRHSKREAENYNYNYNEFVRFWQLNKFTLMVILSIIFLLCSFTFFLMNDVFLSQ